MLKFNTKIINEFVEFYTEIMNKTSGTDTIWIIAQATNTLVEHLSKLKNDILVKNEKGENKNGKN